MYSNCHISLLYSQRLSLMHTSRSSDLHASDRPLKKPFVAPHLERHARLADLTFSASMGDRVWAPSTEYTGEGSINR